MIIVHLILFQFWVEFDKFEFTNELDFMLKFEFFSKK